MCEKYPAFANEAFQVAVDLKFGTPVVGGVTD